MRNDVFIARLARGAATTALVSAAAMPPHRTDASPLQPLTVEQSVVSQPTISPQDETQASTSAFVLTMVKSPSVWDNKLDKEFRGLALAEATGKIAPKDAQRLEQLSLWRDQLVYPQTVEETLLQMKRDRLLNQMEKLLKEYVEFQEEAASQARSASPKADKA